MRALIAALAVAALAATSGAAAARQSHRHQHAAAKWPRSMAHALQIAQAAWGEQCDGPINVDRSREMFPISSSTEGYAQPAACQDGDPADNNIGVRPGMDWESVCTVAVHEYGHLVGNGHSASKASVMYPVTVRFWKPCMPPWQRGWYWGPWYTTTAGAAIASPGQLRA